MQAAPTLGVKNRDEWRAWLKKHHRSETVIWLIYYKKHTGQPRIPYDAAVEEALCFGWIDSTIKRLDDERFMQQFTPRTNHANWSDSNIQRMRALIAAGRVTKAGLAKFDRALLDRKPRLRRMPALPASVKWALMADAKAWGSFQKLAPSYRRTYIWWLTSAKRPETFRKRLRKCVGLLRRGEKLGMV